MRVLPFNQIITNAMFRAVNENQDVDNPQQDVTDAGQEETSKSIPFFSRSSDDWFKPYDRNSQPSVSVRDKAISMGKATKENYKAAYPCYKDPMSKDEAYIYYDAETERLVYVYKPSKVTSPSGEAKDNSQWYMVFGDAKATGKTSMEKSVSGETEETALGSRMRYADLYEIWITAGAYDQVKSNYRRTGGQKMPTEVTQLGSAMKEIMMRAVRKMKTAKGPDWKTGTPMPIQQPGTAEQRYTVGKATSTAHTQPSVSGEHMRKIGPHGYYEWYNKHIGKTSKTGGSRKSGAVGEMIAGLGLTTEEYAAKYDNIELLRILNAVIQLNPHVHPRYKTGWREALANIFQEYAVMSKADIENDPYGDYLYDKSVVDNLSRMDARVRKDLRFKLLKIIADIFLKGEYESARSKEKGDTSSSEFKKFAHPKQRAMGFESLDVPDFSTFLVEGFDDDKAAQRDKKQSMWSNISDEIRKTRGSDATDINTNDLAAKVYKNVKRGIYFTRDAERGDITRIIFDVLSTMGAYIDVKLADNSVRAAIVPSAGEVDQYIPQYASDYYVIEFDNSEYYAYENKHTTREMIFDKYVKVFDDKEEAEDAVKRLDEFGMHNGNVVKYDDAIRAYYDKQIKSLQAAYGKDHDKEDAMAARNNFYINPADKSKPRDRSLDDIGEWHGRALMEELYRVIMMDSVAAIKKIGAAVEKSRAKSNLNKVYGKDYSGVESAEGGHEMVGDFKKYGQDPATLYQSSPAVYLQKSADFIDGMSKAGIDGTTVRNYVNRWYEMANAALDIVGSEIEEPVNNNEVSEEAIDAVIGYLPDKNALIEKDYVLYTICMAFLQLLIRDIGGEYIMASNLKTGGKETDDQPEADDADTAVEQMSIYDVWESYMDAAMREESDSDDEDTKEAIRRLRSRLVKIAVKAMEDADVPEEQEEKYTERIRDFVQGTVQSQEDIADYARENPEEYAKFAKGRYLFAKEILSNIEPQVAEEYKDDMKQAVQDFYDRNGKIIRPEALIRLIKAPVRKFKSKPRPVPRVEKIPDLAEPQSHVQPEQTPSTRRKSGRQVMKFGDLPGADDLMRKFNM